jgi:hypothetical protein
MRRVGAFLLLVVLVSMPGAVNAQHAGHGEIGSEDNTVVVADGPQDVEIYVAPKVAGQKQNATQCCGNNFDHLDVLKIVFGEETENDFKVTVQFKTLASALPTGAGSRAVYFAYGKVNWRLAPGNCNQRQQPGQAPASAPTGCLSGNGGGQRGFKAVPWEVRAGETSWVFTVPKASLFNENRVPARFGDSLTNITAVAQQSLAGLPFGGGGGGGDITGGAYAYDRAPNTGFGPQFTFVKGANGRGHLALAALEPIRVSNGEATTIVYKVEITNHNTEPLTASLESIVDKKYLDQGWTARVPSLLKLEAKQVLVFPVILALPFTHNHGETALFKVAARTLEDSNSYAEVGLGVFWTDVPQPSAHHEGEAAGTWFHSKPSDDDFPPQAVREQTFPIMETWMNGVPEDPDPEATDRNVPAFFNEGLGCTMRFLQGCQVPPTWTASWQVPLSPSLLLGLDFDTSKKGRLVVDILPKVPAASARVVAQLQYCDPTQQTGGGQGQGGRGGFGNQTCYNYRTLLAKGEQSKALTANTPTNFEITLDIEPIADLVPYRKGHNVRLNIQLITTDIPQNLMGTEPRPELVTDKALLQLPLIEYHDPVDQAFENVGTLALESLSPFEKLVNPGKTTVFQFNVVSSGKDTQPIRLELQGVNSDWATLHGPDRFDLAPGQKRNVTISVRAPEDAVAEERAELFFVAQHEGDQSVVAVTRLRASVVQSPEIEDEAGLLGSSEENQSPGLGAFVIVAALAGVVGLLRIRKNRLP